MGEPPKEDVDILDLEGYLEARYLGPYTIVRYKAQMEKSVLACLDRKLKRLLVDITGVSGFLPTVAERHQIGVTGASLSRDLEKVAIVLSPDQVDPDAFMSRVASNRGLTIQAFIDRTQALEWLKSPLA